MVVSLETRHLAMGISKVVSYPCYLRDLTAFNHLIAGSYSIEKLDCPVAQFREETTVLQLCVRGANDFIR